MNSKKSNWLYLLTIVLYLGILNLLSYVGAFALMPETLLTILPELIIVVPALCFVFFQQEPANRTFGFHKIRFTNLLLLIVYILLFYPLITFANAISMIFVDNVIAESANQFYSMGFLKTFLLVAVVPAFCEELVVRGAIYGGYRREGASIGAIVLSSLIFGLLHMNLNQAPYAFVIGVVICLAYEATGSIFAGMFIHLMINGFSVFSMFLLNSLDENALEETESLIESTGMATKEYYATMAGSLLIVSLITVPLAICLLHFIAKRQGRETAVKNIWHYRKENKKRIITVPLIIGLVINIGYMILVLSMS